MDTDSLLLDVLKEALPLPFFFPGDLAVRLVPSLFFLLLFILGKPIDVAAQDLGLLGLFPKGSFEGLTGWGLPSLMILFALMTGGFFFGLGIIVRKGSSSSSDTSLSIWLNVCITGSSLWESFRSFKGFDLTVRLSQCSRVKLVFILVVLLGIYMWESMETFLIATWLLIWGTSVSAVFMWAEPVVCFSLLESSTYRTMESILEMCFCEPWRSLAGLTIALSWTELNLKTDWLTNS